MSNLIFIIGVIWQYTFLSLAVAPKTKKHVVIYHTITISIFNFCLGVIVLFGNEAFSVQNILQVPLPLVVGTLLKFIGSISFKKQSPPVVLTTPKPRPKPKPLSSNHSSEVSRLVAEVKRLESYLHSVKTEEQQLWTKPKSQQLKQIVSMGVGLGRVQGRIDTQIEDNNRLIDQIEHYRPSKTNVIGKLKSNVKVLQQLSDSFMVFNEVFEANKLNKGNKKSLPTSPKLVLPANGSLNLDLRPLSKGVKKLQAYLKSLNDQEQHLWNKPHAKRKKIIDGINSGLKRIPKRLEKERQLNQELLHNAQSVQDEERVKQVEQNLSQIDQIEKGFESFMQNFTQRCKVRPVKKANQTQASISQRIKKIYGEVDALEQKMELFSSYKQRLLNKLDKEKLNNHLTVMGVSLQKMPGNISLLQDAVQKTLKQVWASSNQDDTKTRQAKQLHSILNRIAVIERDVEQFDKQFFSNGILSTNIDEQVPPKPVLNPTINQQGTRLWHSYSYQSKEVFWESYNQLIEASQKVLARP